MANPAPSSPHEWRAWAESAFLSQIPAMTSREETSANLFLRDIFVDLASLQMDRSYFHSVYSDVLALSAGATMQLALPELALVSLYTRVITSDQPVTLELSPSSLQTAQVVIWATDLDHAVSVSLAGQEPQALNLGAGTGNVGVSIIVRKGVITLTYLDKYKTPDLRPSGHLSRLLATQLRIASTLFWTQPLMASAVAWHVARATSPSAESAFLNVQASALQKQIHVSLLAGPEITYAPVLKLAYYRTAIVPVLQAGAAFQRQYDRFTDKAATVEDQLKAWDSMHKQAQRALSMQQRLADNAKAKWNASQKILLAAQSSMRSHQLTLDAKGLDFRVGIEVWKQQQKLKAAVNILKAVITFGVAIGAMCVGDPGPAAGAPAQAADAAKAVNKVLKVVDVESLTKLKKVVEMLAALLATTITSVNSIIKATGKNGTLAALPAAEKGTEDLQALAGVAAWDRWILDIDDQMKFAVSEGIGGASAYLLELRKHAIDGKLTTQASAQTVKAGQEFVQAQLALHLAQADLARLAELRDSFKGEKDQYEVARLHFYDRMDAMRTSVLIELRNLVWAFKFYTLTESKVLPDPLKDMEDYQGDLALLVQEVEKWEEGFASDKSPIHFKRCLDDTCFNGIGPDIVSSLKAGRTATFALAPTPPAAAANFPHHSGPFTGGSGFRVFGMRVFLVGAVPKPGALAHKGTAPISLAIRTSGTYQDIREDGAVLGFTRMPQERQFKYLVDREGRTVPEPDGVEVESIIPMGNHMDPPPFTQWTITVNQPETLDLSGLTGVELEWRGEAYL
ncbi:hypothetical protein HDZ31DRAFT_33794 [Schizophyllum fasciatum]